MESRSISTQLRMAIETCGYSCYRIAKETGISQAALSRFMSGKRGLALESVDKLAALLKLRLVGGVKVRKGQDGERWHRS